MPSAPRLADVDLAQHFDDKDAYEKRLRKVQLRLLEQEQRYFHEQRRAIVAFEGWDAAGKGGSIRRLTERLDPRSIRVHPISAPTAEEQGRHYLYRFWNKLPAKGEWALFDRTWYGRVLVERVEKLAKKSAWGRAYGEINAFEKMLTDDGVVLVKIFLHISKKEQLRRFKEREDNPYKRFKITDEDWRNRKQWGKYEQAIDDMLAQTHTTNAPWHVIPSEHKWFGRVAVCETVADALEGA